MECKDGVCFLKKSDDLEMNVFEFSDTGVVLEWIPRAQHEKFQVDVSQGDATEWRTLSDTLTVSFLRKKTLQQGERYQFRVRGFAKGAWSPFSKSIEVQAPKTINKNSPRVVGLEAQKDGRYSALVQWPQITGASHYALQFRRMASESFDWIDVASELKGTSVKKKNLEPAPDYIFRYRACHGDGTWGAWSNASSPSGTVSVPSSIISYVGNTLIRGNSNEQVDAKELGGKLVALYFSAHWCPPCKMKTRQMVQAYPVIRQQGLPFEIIFVSADHDEQSYNVYRSEMPWLAMPWNSNRAQLQSQFQVTGIPKLVVFSKTGQLITDAAASAPLTVDLVNFWLAKN